MSTFTGGALKLKGGVVLQKKKFKKADKDKEDEKIKAAMEIATGGDKGTRLFCSLLRL